MEHTLKTILEQANLHESEINVYALLLEEGPHSAAELATKTGIKRSNVYYTLENLEQKQLVEKFKKGRAAHFRTTHPRMLQDHLLKQRNNIEDARKTVEAHMDTLSSTYNLVNHKPGISFFEGVDGFKDTLYHSLEAKETIYSFVNSDVVEQYVNDIDTGYVKQRIKKKIHKHIIMANTPEAKVYINEMNKTYTKVKLLDNKKFPFEMAMEVYNNTTSYLQMSDEGILAFLIQNPEVAKLHRSLFEYIWSTLPE